VSEACGAFDRLIAARGTGGLPAGDEVRLRDHLASCASCADVARLYASEGASDDDPAPAPAAAPPAYTAGALLAGRYRLEREVGRGGMGVVWEATQTTTGQRVALKLLFAAASPKARRRALREARAACAVRHPAVVRVFDVVEADDGAPALVMELLHGHSLQRRFDAGPVPCVELCGLLAPVAEALAAAHAVGVVHRDLKPDNVLLTDEPGGARGVRLLDFGVAKHQAGAPSATAGDLTRDGALVGTPYYMAPEQALGEDDIDARADVWALGLLLYQGLSGTLPTRGPNLGRVIRAIAIDPLPPLARMAPHAPTALLALVGRMLTRDREARPAEMGPIARELAALSRGAERPRRDGARRAAVAVAGLALVGGCAAAMLPSTRAPTGRSPALTATPEVVASAPSTTEPARADGGAPARAAATAAPLAPAPLGSPKGAPRARVAASTPALARPSEPTPPSASPAGLGVEREF
jgi:serine/threonine-protein kinase